MSNDPENKSFWKTIIDIASKADPIRILHDRYSVNNTGTINTSSTTGSAGGYSSPPYGAVPPVMNQSTRYGTNYSPMWVTTNTGGTGPYYSATTDSYYYGTPTPNMEEIDRRLDAIERRLLIVHPEKYLLDKYPDLAVAYEQYKNLEDQYRTYDILKENKENG